MALTVGDLVAYLRADDRDFNSPMSRAKRVMMDVANQASAMGSRMDSAAGVALRAANNIAKLGTGIAAISAVKAAVGGLAGSLGVIPGIAAAAAAAIATIKIGTSGMGKAIAGLGKSTGGGGGGGGGGGAEKAISDARRIADAERGVQRAQEQVTYAQESLTRARERAARTIEDMQHRLQGAALDEESAMLALERARERLAKVPMTEGATDLDMREAQLGVKQAEQALADTRREYGQLSDEAAKAAKAGVDGSDEVISAQRGVQDAMRGVEDAQRSLAEAHQDAGAAAAGAAGGGGAVNEEFNKLSPNAKAVALAIHGLRDEWLGLKHSVQDALFAGVASDIKSLAGKYLPVAKEGFTGIATEINRGARETAAYLGEARQVKDVGTIFGNVRKAIGNTADTAKPLTSIFLDIMTVSSEFLPGLTGGFGGAAQKAAEFIRHARETGQLKEWIQGGLDVLGKVWKVLTNIGSIIGTVWQAFDTGGAGALDTMIALTQKVKEFLKSAEGQAGLKALAGIIHTVAEVGGKLLMIVLEELARLLVDIGPQVEEFARQLGEFLAGALRTVVPMLADAAKWIMENAYWLGPLAIALYAGVKAFEAVTAAMKIFNLIASANPWLILIAATIALVTLIVTHWDKIKEAVKKALDWVAEKVGEVWGWIERNIIDHVQAFASAVDRGINNIVQWFKDLPGKIWEALKNLGRDMWNAGVDAVKGFIDGFVSMIGRAIERVKNFARDIRDGFFHILGISSPSKVFRYGGLMAGEGVVQGMRASESSVAAAAARMADAALVDIPAPRVDPLPIGAGGPGGAGPGAGGSGAAGGRPMVVIQPDGTRASAMLLEVFRESVREQGGDVQLVLGNG